MFPRNRELMMRIEEQDVDKVIKLVKDNDSFVANVRDPYDLSCYPNITPSNLRITAMLDRNFYTRISALAEGGTPKSEQMVDYRWAAAVMAFCQIGGVEFHYLSSLAEYESSVGPHGAAKQLMNLHVADNIDPAYHVAFACGRIDRIPVEEAITPSTETWRGDAGQSEERDADFRLNYLMVLKAMFLDSEQLSQAEKMLRFLDWMADEFMLGAPATMFANQFFSPARPTRLVKRKDVLAAKNAAWDLALIQEWRRRMLKECAETDDRPVFLITRDKGVREVARRLVAEDVESFERYILDFWPKKQKDGRRVLDHYYRRSSDVSALGDARTLPSREWIEHKIQDFEAKFQFGPTFRA